MALPEKSHPLFLESGRVVFGFSPSACFQDTSISPKDEGMTLGGAISALQVKLGSLQGGSRARLGRPNYSVMCFFLQILGYVLGGPCNKDCSILGFILGVRLFVETTIFD